MGRTRSQDPRTRATCRGVIAFLPSFLGARAPFTRLPGVRSERTLFEAADRKGPPSGHSRGPVEEEWGPRKGSAVALHDRGRSHFVTLAIAERRAGARLCRPGLVIVLRGRPVGALARRLLRSRSADACPGSRRGPGCGRVQSRPGGNGVEGGKGLSRHEAVV